MPRNTSLAHKLRVDVHAAWLSARDARTSWGARLFGLLVTAYALSPIDLIPDFIPVFGLIDDVILVPIGLWLFVKMLPDGVFEQHRAEAEAASEQPGSVWGAAIVVVLWVLAALLIWRLMAFNFD
ncbi:YkvA family protein [Allosphingosinicella vermicomposti]|uniref:YkvA family protein n=1 Tax=Allosphingosinicella vermicomposti TaxID=614671 RepID=UPI000D0F5A12|nr:YkvA family protein [Allosphingosinicella vermicomposti]